MPISLRVQAVADEASFDRTADKAEKRFGAAGQESGKAFAKGLDDAIAKADPKAVDRWTGAYDKLRDATGKVRAEEAKLADLRSRGASDARIVSQAEALERARRAEARATRGATEAYDGLTASGSRLFDTLSELSAGTRLGGVIGDAEALAGRLGGVGLAVGGATVAVAGLAIGIAAAGSKLYELGAMWDDVADSITARTGKVGDDLNAVMDQVTRVAQDSTSSIASLGDIGGRVSASIGATGDHLGELTAYIGDLNEITKDQTNIKQLGMLYRVFNVEASEQIPMLNQLYTAYTQTQTPVNDLIGMLVKAGPAFKQFGFDAGQTVGVLASFNDAGVDPEKALTGLQKGLKAAADAGRDPKQVLSEVVAKIKELHDAGNDVGATKLATDFFGTKNAPAFLEAIESGRLSVNQLNSSIQQQAIDIRDTKAATDDAAQEFDKLTHRLGTALKPAADAAFSGINTALEWAITQIETLSDLLSGDFSSVINRIKSDWNDLWGNGPSSWIGGGADGGNFGNDSGSVRGTPGRGFPMPWTLPPLAGQSARDYAHERMMPFWQSQGFTVGDHADPLPGGKKFGEHQNGAIDIMVPSIAAGQQVLRQVLSDPNVYGAIFNNQTFGYGHGTTPQDYSAGHTGNPTQDHQDHVHVWYKPGNDGNIKPSGMRAFGPRQSPSLGPQPSSDGPQPSGSGPGTSGGSVSAVPLGASTSTPGYDDQGRPGYYVTDPKGIRSAQERIGDIQDNITKADQRIADVKKSIGDANDRILEAQQAQLEAIQKAAEIQADITATEDQKRSAERQVKSANDAVTRATEARDRIVNRDLPDAQAARDRLQNRDLRDATEALADAQRGNFTSARSGSSRSAGGWGAPIAADFGMSGGLAGLAENMTNFLGNLAFAPVFGALSGVSAAGDPTGAYQGAGGLIGMMAAGSGIGGPLGGGPTTVGGIAPTAGTGGAGFGGLGGLPMAGLQAAAASLDAVAPGASIAANMGIQLSNRAIAQMGKVAGIGVGGLLETFSLADSPLSDPSASWFGRLAAGFAGAKPALPNMAGGSAAAPNGTQHGAAQGAAPGPGGITVNYTNNAATEDRAGKDLTNHLTAMYAGPGL